MCETDDSSRIGTRVVTPVGPEVQGFYDIPQYAFESQQHMLRGGAEADRAVAVGALEYVPDDMVEEVMTDAIVHPWLVVDQGGGKWRACQDYSGGINLLNDAPPFELDSVWELPNILGPKKFVHG